MDISSLHKSISKYTEAELRIHIRNIRDLRRQFTEVKVRAQKKKGQKRQKKEPNISQMNPNEKQELLQKLLKIKEKRNGKKRS